MIRSGEESWGYKTKSRIGASSIPAVFLLARVFVADRLNSVRLSVVPSLGCAKWSASTVLVRLHCGQMADEDTQSSLEKIKKRLANASATCIMEGALLKRSETLRKWNQRWFTLDPTTGKMEYRLHHGDANPRGVIHFESDSTITLSPINFHGLNKYDGCCLYIGSPQKKEYFLCAETPTIARAWVSTLRSAALVLKAHKEAVDSLSGNGHAKLGTVAAVVSAANATAREGMKEIHMSMKQAVKQGPSPQRSHTHSQDMSDVVKETLRVKDEELNQMARDLRARDFTIKEMADRLSETAEAAEAAASAAKAMDKERRNAHAEIELLRKEFEERLYLAAREVRMAEERTSTANKTRDEALLEAQRWRVELGKANEQMVVMQGAVVRAEESARRAITDAEEKIRLAKGSELGALAAKEEAFQLAKQWQAQADYYRDQAARYLGILQERDAQEQRQAGYQEGVSSVEEPDNSGIETPVALSSEKTVKEIPFGVTYENMTSDSPAGRSLERSAVETFAEVQMPVETNEGVVDKGTGGDSLTYRSKSLETRSAGSEVLSESKSAGSAEVEAAVVAAVETIPSAQTPELSAVDFLSESPSTVPSAIISTELLQTESREFTSGLAISEIP
ncbi:hypothetical protein R1flu_000405 [Riccia fluitans]|uniref:PH domain-containing protein n=1 Tax=Riccia fluitans TaxID=41844 RepID=A0ABD1Y0D9_9MARC